MTLSVFLPIQCADIIEVRMYKALKVFLLCGIDGSELVIKTDALTDGQIKSSGHAVKAIDPSAKMKILTPVERRELETYCEIWLDVDSFFESIGVGSPVPGDKSVVKDLKESLGFGFPFTKMAKQIIHNIEDAAIQRLEGNKAVVRTFVKTLTAKNGLESLGQVVAGDLFNANKDRFNPYQAPKEQKFGSISIHVRVLVNAGNVMLVATQGGFKVSMLDYVDPNSQFKDPNVPLATAETAANLSGQGGYWRTKEPVTNLPRTLSRTWNPSCIHTRGP